MRHDRAKSRRKRRFVCIACGFVLHADVNAALGIRGRAQLALTSEPYPAQDAGRRTRCAASPQKTKRMQSFSLNAELPAAPSWVRIAREEASAPLSERSAISTGAMRFVNSRAGGIPAR
jgi:hypothetical protein